MTAPTIITENRAQIYASYLDYSCDSQ